MSGTDDVPRHEQCWAKTKNDRTPGISVRNHCLNVGWVAEALLALLPARLRERIPNCAPALAALHDVGKVSPGFQLKIKLAGIKRRKTELPASITVLKRSNLM